MNICPKCGEQCPDYDKFCEKCGAALPEIPPAYNENTSPAVRYNTSAVSEGEGTRTDIQWKLKQLCRSKLALFIALLFTFSLIASAVGAFLVPNAIAAKLSDFCEWAMKTVVPYAADAGLDEILDMDDFDEYAEEVISAVEDAIDEADLNSASGTTSISINFVPALTAVAFWVIFITAMSKKQECCSYVGFVIIRVIRIISFVGLCILLALVAGGIAISAGVMYESGYGDYFPIVASILGSIFAIMLIKFFYQIGVLRSLLKFKTVAQNVEPKGSVWGFSCVIMYIKGVCRCLIALGGFVAVSWLGMAGVLLSLAGVAAAVTVFLQASFMSRARKALKA